jgi:hypothetical protein
MWILHFSLPFNFHISLLTYTGIIYTQTAFLCIFIPFLFTSKFVKKIYTHPVWYVAIQRRDLFSNEKWYEVGVFKGDLHIFSALEAAKFEVMKAKPENSFVY